MRFVKNYLKKLLVINTPLAIAENFIKHRAGIVFLMYHSITEEESSYPYSTSKSNFKEHMRFLNVNYSILTIDQAYDYLAKGIMPSTKGPYAVITFDDGFKDNLVHAYPILKEYEAPFCIFLTEVFIKNKNCSYLSFDDVKVLGEEELATFGCHGASHSNLRSVDKRDLSLEIVHSKHSIEQATGVELNYFAYPSGGFTENSLSLVSSNYKMAFKDRTNGNNDKDLCKVARISIDINCNLPKRFVNTLFYTNHLKP